MPCLSWPRLASPCLSLPCLASPVLYRVSWVSFGQILTEKGGRRFASGSFCPCGQAPDARVSPSGRRRRFKSSGICYTPARAEIVRRGGPYDSQKRGPNRPTDLALPRLALPRLALPCLASMQSFLGFFLPPPLRKGRRTNTKRGAGRFCVGRSGPDAFCQNGRFLLFSSISLGKNAHFWPTAVRSWGPYDPWRMGRNRLARRR